MNIYAELCNIIPGFHISSKEWATLNCPMCVSRGHPRPDTKKRCGIKLLNGNGVLIHCFNCKFAASWEIGNVMPISIRNFLKCLNVSVEKINQLSFNSWRLKEHKSVDNLDHIHNFQKRPLPDKAKLLDDCDDVEQIIKIKQYVDSRDKSLLKKYDFYWTPDMPNLVLMPIYYHQDIYGYTSRNILPSTNNRFFSSYPSNIIFNMPVLENMNYKYIFITEGIFDALIINGMALMGSSLNDIHCNQLEMYKDRVVFVPDFDVSGMSLMKQAVDRGFKITMPKFGRNINDVNDAVKKYGKLFVVKSLIESILNDDVKAKVMIRYWLTTNKIVQKK